MNQLKHDPLRGGLFENLVILELMKYRMNQGLDPNLYFYRDNHQNEVDVIIKSAHELIPIEIKSAETFSMHFLKGIKYYKKLTNRCPLGFVVYGGMHEQGLGEFETIHYRNASVIWQKVAQRCQD